MRLPQLYKVFQDTKQNWRIDVVYPCYFINHISCTLVKRPLHDGGYIFADRTQGPFRTWPLKNKLYPALKQLYNQSIVAYDST